MTDPVTAQSITKRRVLAFLIDGLLAMGLTSLLNGLGVLAAIGYWLVRDGLFEGQSIGKRVMRLRVVISPSRTPCTIGASIPRNILWVIPVVNVVMILVTLYGLLRQGGALRHWGDRLADSQVIADPAG
jgi:uncharacterized RDD family membrane protein YckC